MMLLTLQVEIQGKLKPENKRTLNRSLNLDCQGKKKACLLNCWSSFALANNIEGNFLSGKNIPHCKMFYCIYLIIMPGVCHAF